MQMADMPYDLPDDRGHFGPYGGVFVAETLIRALDELQRAVRALSAAIPEFVAEFEDELDALRRPAVARSITRGAGRKSSAARRSG